MEIGGPTMLDLRIRFDSNSEEVARSVSAQGVGIFLGALIGGVFVDMLGTWKILLVICAQLLSTVSILSMPLIDSLSVMWLMFFVLGTATGIVNVCKYDHKPKHSTTHNFNANTIRNGKLSRLMYICGSN